MLKALKIMPQKTRSVKKKNPRGAKYYLNFHANLGPRERHGAAVEGAGDRRGGGRRGQSAARPAFGVRRAGRAVGPSRTGPTVRPAPASAVQRAQRQSKK